MIFAVAVGLLSFTSAGFGQPTFALTLSGETALSGNPGSVIPTSCRAVLTAGGDLGGEGAQGWALSIASDGASRITAVTTNGTAGANVPDGLRNGGFEKSELSRPGVSIDGCANRIGAVSAVVLSFTLPITLPIDSPSDIAALSIESTIPGAGTAMGSIFYVDGCRGSGQPVSNTITHMSNTVQPSLGRKDITLEARVDCSVAPLNGVFQAASLGQVPELFAGAIGEAGLDVQVPTGQTGTASVWFAIVSQLAAEGVGGAQGWSLSIAVGGDATPTGATTNGTAGANVPDGLRDGGFEKTELVNPNLDPATGMPAADPSLAQGPGAVSAVVLSFTLPITLEATGTATVLCVNLQANSVQGEETLSATVRQRDGLRGAGQPVNNVVTVNGETRNFCELVSAGVNFVPIVVPPMQSFKRGDANSDNRRDIADAIYTINNLFRGGPPFLCADAADFNDDGNVNLMDAILSVNYQFRGGAPPSAPFPGCGTDPEGDDDGVTCAASQATCRG
jgi:hypothetical protein